MGSNVEAKRARDEILSEPTQRTRLVHPINAASKSLISSGTGIALGRIIPFATRRLPNTRPAFMPIGRRFVHPGNPQQLFFAEIRSEKLQPNRQRLFARRETARQ